MKAPEISTAAAAVNAMRVVVMSFLAACLLAPAATGQEVLSGEVHNPQWGVRFTVPEGWIGQAAGEGYLFGSRTDRGLILVLPHDYRSLDALRAEAEKGLHDASGTYLELDGPLDAFGERGVAATFQGAIEGQRARAYAVSVLAPHGGGVTILTAVDPAYYSGAYPERVRAMAEGLQFSEPQTPSAGGDWNARLKGSRLTYLYSYYSGGASGSYAGASEKTTIDLCSAGHFFYSGSSSFAVDGGVGAGYNASGYGGGSDQGAGRWEVVQRGGQPVLQLAFQNGEVAEYTISYPDEELHLDGKRFFWTTHTSPADYRPQCP